MLRTLGLWAVFGVLVALPAFAGECGGGCGSCGAACCSSAEQAKVSWRDLGEAGLKKQLRVVRWELHALNHSDTATTEQITAKRAELAHLNAEYDAFRVAQVALRERLALVFEPRPELRVALADVAAR